MRGGSSRWSIFLFLGKMSVRKLWIAGDEGGAREYTAETTADVLEPAGAVREGDDEKLLDPGAMEDGIANAVKVLSLCNTAT